MRKRTINHLSDSIMWYLIYLFPLLVILMGVFYNNTPMTFYNEFLSWFNLSTGNFVYDALEDLFGTGGILPLFTGNWSFFISYATYFISVMLLHLAVDFLVFIPRLAHKYMNCLTNTEE